MRQISIPTGLDRWIQTALVQVLHPIFDPTFSGHSHGFRPEHSQHQAIAEAQEYIEGGYQIAVDLDLEKFFDRVNHDMLMGRIAKRVKDKRVLKLIRAYLNAGLMKDGVVIPKTEGTPQGGPLSPLLSNIMLDDLDKELEKRGHRFVRYADDCNIFVRSERAGHRVMESITRYIERKLKLRVNREKSAVAPPWERKFLSFTFKNLDRPRRSISPEAIQKFKRRVREIIRKKTASLKGTIDNLRPYLRGWRNYFGFTELSSELQSLEQWIRRRLRCLVWRRWKRGKKRYKELVNRGVSPALARRTAGSNKGPWHLSKSKALHLAFPNAYFAKLGLPDIYRP
jgi:RNA-directed DNA polymerase